MEKMKINTCPNCKSNLVAQTGKINSIPIYFECYDCKNIFPESKGLKK